MELVPEVSFGARLKAIAVSEMVAMAGLRVHLTVVLMEVLRLLLPTVL